MGQVFDGIDAKLKAFLEAQHVFFVATAPHAPDAHLNLSPKGLESFVVLDDRRVGYLDFPGSGVETVAHLRDDGRIVFLFCAFSGPPRIVRLHGRASAVEPTEPEFAALRSRFPAAAMVRSIIVADLDRISDSCGYGVPRYELVGPRDQLQKWAERKGPDGLRDYQRANNRVSIDGLPGLRWAGDD